jgi:predicted RNase H-like HicB family nuclease
MTHYIAFLDHEPQASGGVRVPDLPGCFSAGDDLDDALRNVSEAISLYLDFLRDEGGEPPLPRTMEQSRRDPEVAGMFSRFTVAAVPVRELSAGHVVE